MDDSLERNRRDRDAGELYGPDDAAEASAITSGHPTTGTAFTHLQVREFAIDDGTSSCSATVILPPGLSSYAIGSAALEKFVVSYVRHFWAVQVQPRGVPPHGLVVIPMGCGCGCVDDAETGIRHRVCGATITISQGNTVVATASASGPPCTPPKFTELTSGQTYDITIEAPNYATRVLTGYTFTSWPAGDVYLVADLCEESGKHCLMHCADPGPTAGPLTLTIHEAIPFVLHGGFGVHNLLIDGPVTLTWQSPNARTGYTGWFGETTATYTVAREKTPYPPCSGSQWLRNDCDCFELTTESVPIVIQLAACPPAEAWVIYIYTPYTGFCCSSWDMYEQCVGGTDFFYDPAVASVSPYGLPSFTMVAPLHPYPSSSWPVTIPQSPTLICNPLQIDFLQPDNAVNPTAWSVWGKLTG